MHRTQARSIVIIALVVSLVTIALGVSLPAPKKMMGGLALIWGLVSATSANPRTRRGYAFVGALLATTGAVLLLFASDWATAGRREAVLYVALRDAATNRSIAGATLTLHGAGSPQSGVTDRQGVWATQLVVPYRTDYRLIGPATEFDLTGISLVLDGSSRKVSWELARMSDVAVSGPASEAGPVLLYANLTVSGFSPRADH